MSGWHQDRELDGARVKALVEDQFPELGPATVRYLDEGWDSQVYAVNDRWLFRFPKRQEVEADLHRELAVLPRIAEAVDVPVPRYRFVGGPGPAFPYLFAGYAKLSGLPGTRVGRDRLDRSELARTLGVFLDRLHRIPVPDVLRQGPAGSGAPETASRELEAMRDRARTHLESIRKSLDPDLVTFVHDFLEDPARLPGPTPIPPVLLHNDLYHAHVLIDPATGTTAGVIDWGDLAQGDPSVDFCGLYQWLGREFVIQVLKEYTGPLDPEFLDRCRYRALCFAILDVHYALETGRDEGLAHGLDCLDRISQQAD